MRQKYVVFLTAAALVTSALTIGVSAAQPAAAVSQGQCQKSLAESPEFTKQQAHASCKLDTNSNQGECIQTAREAGDTAAEELCKEQHSPPPKF